MDDLEAKIKLVKPKVLLLIHYFGFPDPNLSMVIKLAEANGILVIEDEAHSMLSDLVGGICGRLSDSAIFSFHKLLPVDQGGALVLNKIENDILMSPYLIDRVWK
jgi:dTDP-4-amino-4,6-dideoxygalactose transaminase